MQAEDVRFVWLMIFFDLPVLSQEQRKWAGQFRTFLKKDGYIMLQLSVYARVCRGEDAIQKHLRRVRSRLPSEGSVRALQVTDKQFGRMELLVGELRPTERKGAGQLVLL